MSDCACGKYERMVKIPADTHRTLLEVARAAKRFRRELLDATVVRTDT